MKKLLLLTKLLIFVFASCQNKQEIKIGKAINPRQIVEQKSIVIETSDSSQKAIETRQNDAGKLLGQERGIKKDTIYNNGSIHSIIHNAPNQAKIDSIKSNKMKSKK